MNDFIFITGNQHKVEMLTKWLGRPFEHKNIDLDELQSLDPKAVATHKVEQAYAIMQRPVLVEDISVTFDAMGRLPGTFIKWFLEELGTSGLAKLAHSLSHQKATAMIVYVLYDGKQMHFFEHKTHGVIAPEPRGEGFGWNPVFIPEGSSKTYAEMSDDELKQFGHRAPAVAKLKQFLNGSDANPLNS